MQSPETPFSSGVPAEEPTDPWYAPFARRPAITLLCLAAGLGVGVAASLVLSPKYLARGKIILPNSTRSSAFAGLAGSLGIQAGDTGSLPMFAAILRSETMVARIAALNGLTRKEVRKVFNAKDDPKSNTIEITVTGRDPERALKIARTGIQALSDIASKVNLPLKEDQSVRLRASLANRQRDLEANERALKAFLESAKTLPSGGGLQASVKSPSGDAQGGGTNDAATIAPGLGYRQQLSSLEIQLRSLESSAAAIQANAKAQETTPPLDLPPVRLWAERIAQAQANLAELRPRYRAGSPEVVEAEETLTNVQAAMRRDVERYLANVRASLTGTAQTLSVTRAGIETQIAEVKKYVDAAPQGGHHLPSTLPKRRHERDGRQPDPADVREGARRADQRPEHLGRARSPRHRRGVRSEAADAQPDVRGASRRRRRLRPRPAKPAASPALSARATSLLNTSVLVTLATVGVAVVSFVNQLLIARLFGVSADLTAYSVATSGPTTVGGVLIGGVTYSLVPLLVRARLDDEDADRFFGGILLRMFLAACGVAALGMLLSNPLVDYLGRSLDEPALRLAREVGHVSWLTLAFTMVLAQLSAVHDAGQRFLLPVAGNAGPYLGMIVGGLLGAKGHGVLAIAYGMLGGTLLSVFALSAGVLREARFAPLSRDQRDRVSGYFGRVPGVAVSMLIFTAFPFVDAFWAPQIDAGSLPTLGFGQRLLVAFGTLVCTGPFAILVPRLATAAAEGRHEDFRSDVGRALRTVVGLGGFVAVAVSVLASPLVYLLFQRGRFDAEATARVVAVLPWMMGGMVPMLGIVLLYRAFFARDWLRPAVGLSVGLVAGYFALSGLLSHLLGTVGIAVAYAAVWTVSLACALPILWRGHVAELVGPVFRTFARDLALTLAGTAGSLLVLDRLMLGGYAELGRLQVVLRIGVAGAVGLMVFYSLSVRVFGMDDARFVFDYFGGLGRRLARREGARVNGSATLIRAALAVQNGLLWLAALPWPRRDVRRILLFRNGRIGDFVVAIPAMVALRERYPEAEIVLLSATSTVAGASVVARSLQGASTPPWFDFVAPSTIDRIVSLDGQGRREIVATIRATVRELRPDATVLVSSNLDTFGQRLKKILSFRLAGSWGPIVGWRMRQSIQFDTKAQHDAGMLEHNVVTAAKSVFEMPGMPRYQEDDLRFRMALGETVERRVDALWEDHGLTGRRVVALFPGATFDHKQWPVAHWTALAETLRSEPDVRLVVLGAPSDRPVTEALMQRIGGFATDLTGAMGLAELTGFLSRATLYIGSDTGPMHLSTAMGTPTVGVMNHQELGDTWAPWNSRDLGLKHDVPCKGCYSLFFCPNGTKVCIDDLPVERVLRAALSCLQTPSRPRTL